MFNFIIIAWKSEFKAKGLILNPDQPYIMGLFLLIQYWNLDWLSWIMEFFYVLQKLKVAGRLFLSPPQSHGSVTQWHAAWREVITCITFLYQNCQLDPHYPEIRFRNQDFVGIFLKKNLALFFFFKVKSLIFNRGMLSKQNFLKSFSQLELWQVVIETLLQYDS